MKHLQHLTLDHALTLSQGIREARIHIINGNYEAASNLLSEPQRIAREISDACQRRDNAKIGANERKTEKKKA